MGLSDYALWVMSAFFKQFMKSFEQVHIHHYVFTSPVKEANPG
jgi:hypothetical protein